MSDIFRNKLRKYDRISDIVAGLINYRIMNQGLQKPNVISHRKIQVLSNYARDLLKSGNINKT